MSAVRKAIGPLFVLGAIITGLPGISRGPVGGSGVLSTGTSTEQARVIPNVIAGHPP